MRINIMPEVATQPLTPSDDAPSTQANDLLPVQDDTVFSDAVETAKAPVPEEEAEPRQPSVSVGSSVGFTDGGEEGNSGTMVQLNIAPAQPLFTSEDGNTKITARAGLNRNQLTTPEGEDASNTILSTGVRASHTINPRLNVYADQQLDFRNNDNDGGGFVDLDSVTSYTSGGANYKVVDGENTDVDLGIRGRVVTGVNTNTGDFNDVSWRAALMPKVTQSVGPDTDIFVGGFAEARSTGGSPVFANVGVQHRAGDLNLSAEYRRNITGPDASTEPFGNQRGENMLWFGVNGRF
jgi:hypothetical protein